MTFQHLGLYASSSLAEQSQKHREDEPLSWAWAWLSANENDFIREKAFPTPENKRAKAPVTKPALSPLGQAIAWGTAYRYLQDEAQGLNAVNALKEGLEWSDANDLRQTLMQTLAMGHLFELVRPHPALTFSQAWLARYEERVMSLITPPQENRMLACWQNALKVGAGVTLNHPEWLTEAQTLFIEMIQDVHPEGYFKFVAENKREMGFPHQFYTVVALVLTAEIAEHAQHDFWAIENRGVTLGTAVSYVVYYYFFPDKWRWGDAPSDTDVRDLVREHGAFFEMAHHRAKLLRGIDTLLDENRPYFSPLAGGLTTLTHGIPRKEPKKRGWLW